MVNDNYLISTDALAARLGTPGLVVFDASSGPVPTPEGELPAAQAFAQAHIPGARWLDQGQLLSRPETGFPNSPPPAPDIARAFESLGISDDTTVVLYAAGGAGWAARAWWLLYSIGFQNARILDGGLQKWRAEQRPLAQGATDHEAAPGRITVQAREAFADVAQVRQAVARKHVHVVDALPPAQYDGSAPSRHGRRGHIAGAVNVPSQRFLDAGSNTYLPPEAAQAALQAAGIDAAAPQIHYCGGGIAASVTAFAAVRAGHRDVRVYAESLAQWARDASLPMVPGTPS